MTNEMTKSLMTSPLSSLRSPSSKRWCGGCSGPCATAMPPRSSKASSAAALITGVVPTMPPAEGGPAGKKIVDAGAIDVNGTGSYNLERFSSSADRPDPPRRSSGARDRRGARASDAASVAPGEDVKLRQHRGGEPMVRRHLAREPAQATHGALEIGRLGYRSAGGLQRRRIADLEVDRQRWTARGRRPGMVVVGVIEHDDLEDTARTAARGLDAGFERIPVRRHAG